MPWCVLLINIRTLETRTDYGCFRGSYINESITAELSQRPGEALRHKMLAQVKARCHVILLDPGARPAKKARKKG